MQFWALGLWTPATLRILRSHNIFGTINFWSWDYFLLAASQETKNYISYCTITFRITFVTAARRVLHITPTRELIKIKKKKKGISCKIKEVEWDDKFAFSVMYIVT